MAPQTEKIPRTAFYTLDKAAIKKAAIKVIAKAAS